MLSRPKRISREAASEYAVVTGASSGIGRAFALELASMGLDLLLTGRRTEALQALSSQIQEEYAVKVDCVLGDLALEETRQQVKSAMIARTPLFLVNNAGFGADGRFLVQDREMIQAMTAVHCLAPIEFCHSAAPGMLARGKGYIINVSSLAALLPLASNVLYTSTKAMLHQFSLSFGLSLLGEAVRVQSLLPGFTHTGFHDRLKDFTQPRKSRGLIRWQSAEDLARASLRRILGSSWKSIAYVPGYSNRLLLRLTRLLPWSIYRKIGASL